MGGRKNLKKNIGGDVLGTLSDQSALISKSPINDRKRSLRSSAAQFSLPVKKVKLNEAKIKLLADPLEDSKIKLRVVKDEKAVNRQKQKNKALINKKAHQKKKITLQSSSLSLNKKKLKSKNRFEISQDDPRLKNLCLEKRKPVQLLTVNKSLDVQKLDEEVDKLLKDSEIPSPTAAYHDFFKRRNIYLKLWRSKINDEDGLDSFLVKLMSTYDQLRYTGYCHTRNIKLDKWCEVCYYNLFIAWAKKYAPFNTALEESKQISNTMRSSDVDDYPRLLKMKEISDKAGAEYSHLVKHFITVHEMRNKWLSVSVMAEYNKNYANLFLNAINNSKLKEHVDPRDDVDFPTFTLGLHCSKLLHDILIEFLVKLSGACLCMAYQRKSLQVFKSYAVNYQVIFKVTNSDATYLDPLPTYIHKIAKEYFAQFLPKNEELEKLVVDSLLHHGLQGKTFDSVIFEHVKAPKPFVELLKLIKIPNSFLIKLHKLWVTFFLQLVIEVLKIKKTKVQCSKNVELRPVVNYEELIQACETLGFFSSSYIKYLRKAYTRCYNETV